MARTSKSNANKKLVVKKKNKTHLLKRRIQAEKKENIEREQANEI